MSLEQLLADGKLTESAFLSERDKERSERRRAEELQVVERALQNPSMSSSSRKRLEQKLLELMSNSTSAGSSSDKRTQRNSGACVIA
jgi:hypothetical protein